MKTIISLAIMVLCTTIAFAAYADTPSSQPIHVTDRIIKHKVQADNCRAVKQAILNRCINKYHYSRAFCKKQDDKNYAVCVALIKREKQRQVAIPRER